MSPLYRQAGAIPLRMQGDRLEVLVISTSSGRHLTIPKGLIDPGYDAMDTVHSEAWEEAGITGEIITPPVGSYRFSKWGGVCEVAVFFLRVSRIAEHYPEADQRRRRWLAYFEAADRVKHHDLGELMRGAHERARGLFTGAAEADGNGSGSA